MKSPATGVLLGLAIITVPGWSLRAESDPDPMAGLRALEAPEHRPVAFMDEKLALSQGSTIALMGGTDMLNEQRHGFLELGLRQAFPDRELHFRNIAWSADTVNRQQRPLHFYDLEHFDQRPGSSPDQRQRVKPDALFLWFGKMESLEGADGLDAFSKDYEAMLNHLMTMTPRIVLLTPSPFVQSGPAAELAEERNADLALYSEVIRTLADERGLLTVDLSGLSDPELSWDGIHLNEAGHRAAVSLIISQLTGDQPSLDFPEATPLVLKKNTIWDQYYRPTNWAFLYGDRQNVPSSRDHEDTEKRWFPLEVESAIPLIHELETRLHELSAAH